MHFLTLIEDICARTLHVQTNSLLELASGLVNCLKLFVVYNILFTPLKCREFGEYCMFGDR